MLGAHGRQERKMVEVDNRYLRKEMLGAHSRQEGNTLGVDDWYFWKKELKNLVLRKGYPNIYIRSIYLKISKQP